jgi:SAM-dependent methyltransferase
MAETMLQKLLASAAKVIGRQPSPAAASRARPTTAPAAEASVERLYREKSYLDAYREHTDMRVAEDPKIAIGGLWEEIGRLQIDFLKAEGMRPEHRFLDFGCGTLRGGRHVIPFLAPGNYTGMDISAKAIEHAERLVIEEGLADRQPTLLVSQSQNLQFEEFAGETFDILLAQSVFTHLQPAHIEECFAHIEKVMATGARFYFTFQPAAEITERTVKDFSQPLGFYETLAKRHGFALEDRSAAYPHPRGQQMVKITRPE